MAGVVGQEDVRLVLDGHDGSIVHPTAEVVVVVLPVHDEDPGLAGGDIDCLSQSLQAGGDAESIVGVGPIDTVHVYGGLCEGRGDNVGP